MKVLITGATGLVGKALVKQCLDVNIQVHYLTTQTSKIKQELNYKGFYWNPILGKIDEMCFEGVDTIINLAGATIAKRWTSSYKKEILDSRIKGLQLLKESIETNEFKINHLISASAIGIYPSDLNNQYSEANLEQSDSFLGEVVTEWEATADAFSSINIKVSKIRIGLVLDVKEGAFPKIVQPIKLGIGAAFGNGKQWQSWIHISDLSALFMYVLNQQLVGVYNAVAPKPVTNLHMTKTLAKYLKKPLLLPNVPKFIMRLVLGEMHILLFESQYVKSEKIEDLGFEFKYRNFEDSLDDLL